MTTIVDTLHREFSDILAMLERSGELTLRVTAEDSLRKSLLMAAASYFEMFLCHQVVRYVEEMSGGSEQVVELVRAKAVNRQYHTWFSWEANNANQFFSLFGPRFSEFMKARVRERNELADSIRAFLELGVTRNRLVHGNFGDFALEKTTAEIFEMFQKALLFVDDVPAALREFTGLGASGPRGLGARQR